MPNSSSSFRNFDPRGSREPRQSRLEKQIDEAIFRSTRLSRASTIKQSLTTAGLIQFRSTRLSRASTVTNELYRMRINISIHEALASLDTGKIAGLRSWKNFDPRGSREPRQYYRRTDGRDDGDFDPRGSREPRRGKKKHSGKPDLFRSTRLSRASTVPQVKNRPWYGFRSTRLSRASTKGDRTASCKLYISIHEALASLDYTQAGI